MHVRQIVRAFFVCGRYRPCSRFLIHPDNGLFLKANIGRNQSSMENLYNSLSEIYEGMYQTFINYEEEFKFYSQIIRKHKCKSVVEIGCGTGNLASRFTKLYVAYTGIDLSESMLAIARKNNPDCKFIMADMRNFELTERSDACIITGRSISYMISNKDVYETFLSINKNLKTSGIVCFDFIDANKFIPLIEKDKPVIHKAAFGNKKFHRESFWKLNLAQSWTFDWLSVFYEEDQQGNLNKIGQDNSTVRSFCKDEMTLLLRLTGFQVKDIIERPSYAFDTFVIVGEKVEGYSIAQIRV